jgi:hypothetical protein
MPFNFSFNYKGKNHSFSVPQADLILNNLDKYLKVSSIKLLQTSDWKLKIVDDTSLVSKRIAQTIFKTIVFWEKSIKEDK